MSLFFDELFYISLAQVVLFLLVGLPVGFILIHKNLGLFSDSLSHSLIPGLAASIYFFGISSQSLWIGALGWGLLVSLIFAFLGGLASQKRDSYLVALSLMGISSGLIVNQLFRLKIDFAHLLFGSPLLSRFEDLYKSASITIIVGVLLLFNWKKLLLFSIDSTQAKLRYGSFYLNFLFTLITSLLVIMGFEIFGVFMTTGLLILPGLLFESRYKSFSQRLVLTFVATVAFSILAFFVSYRQNLSFSSVLVFALSTLTFGRFLLKGRS